MLRQRLWGIRPGGLCLLCLLSLTLSCQLSTLAPTRPAPADTAFDLAPSPGTSRAQPLPLPAEGRFKTAHWEIELLQVVRDEAAWELLQDNFANDPPAAGETFVLVQYHIRNTRNSQDEASLGLSLTGNSAVKYYSFDAGIYPPSPYLVTHLAGGESFTGWYGYRMPKSDTDLILIVDEQFEFEEPPLYVALSEGAAIQTDVAALNSVTPTGLGRLSSEPAAVGQMVTTADWQIRVVDLISGEAAWKLAYETNRFNDPPPEDVVYLAVSVWVRYLGHNEDAASIEAYHFKLQGADGTVYERPALVEPDPELDFDLFPGGQAEGWLLLQAPVDHQDLTLIFQPGFRDDDPNVRYLTLVQYGR